MPYFPGRRLLMMLYPCPLPPVRAARPPVPSPHISIALALELAAATCWVEEQKPGMSAALGKAATARGPAEGDAGAGEGGGGVKLGKGRVGSGDGSHEATWLSRG